MMGDVSDEDVTMEALRVEDGDTVVVTAGGIVGSDVCSKFKRALVRAYRDQGKEVLVVVVDQGTTVDLIKADKMNEMKVVTESWIQRKQRQRTETYLQVRLALELEEWNVSRAAKRLGCPTSALRREVFRWEDLRERFGAQSQGVGRPRNKLTETE